MALAFHPPISGVPKPRNRNEDPEYWDLYEKFEKEYFALQQLKESSVTGVFVSESNYWGNRILIEIKYGKIVKVEYPTQKQRGNLTEKDVLEASDIYGHLKRVDEDRNRWDTFGCPSETL